MIKVIHGELYLEDTNRLDQMINTYNSCIRYSYNRFKKQPDLKFNDVRILSKSMYPSINTRWISDAVLQDRRS